ncbi:substrate-binding domain-containing protein [Ketogulonicigenium vulgare]|uniref:ABC-type phosphate transport system periplasmic component-like protein n=1 Tax=Ketogulonicigenium vulgare (strain WSH-001) TaxID=759362 RepID=F9Y9M5_KETVW|nr:substrate-binding domain-containing protein [Ketogulonicigenium vulgare]ADO41348.1 phosphate ABC transporter, periplasmic phosphate-binding protein [Ketogulonicigenium vulgare Y25]AEM41363.1 ABC-type phosphate transport system periplasmic component-like protein [Ketogulonicigenium vulgare WSH-001]ALJ81502.1 phosphonate ABC transporter substrate-binding protein [Ketogulonicigenium vulgare]ANW34211.1 phosphonate ABC transporter substrate-binding protein [Ketogulonicigenium vulgare]AOZ55108.1 
MSLKTVCVSAIAIAAVAGAAQARDNIQIAGSSTVLPYASIVAESFGENFPEFPVPVVESGGSSGGLQRFCAGIGENQTDIANSSRPIRAGEIETCAANGVTDIIEVRVGYDGIVFASALNGPEFAFTPADWYKALAAEVVVDGEIVPNPYTTWDQVNPALPAQQILAFIPGTRHGTREVFDEKVLVAGCEESGAAEVLSAARGDEAACVALRTDGVSVDIDGDYTETLARIAANPQALGVFGLSFYENNTDTLRVATMSDIEPTVEAIATGTYPVSRPLYFYIKKAHIGVIPGLKEYAEFFMSDDMAGPAGPLAQYGLVSDPELAETQALIANETVMASN